MKDEVLFIQGGGRAVHDQCDHRTVENLERELGPDYEIRYPGMPHEADPKYSDWKAALQFARLDEGAIVVGHSIGGTILLRTLADDRPSQNLGGIFLIAPPFVEMADGRARLPEQTPMYLYHGDKDGTVPFAHVDLYARAIPRALCATTRSRSSTQ